MKYKTLVVSLTKEVVGQGYHDLSDPSWEAAQIDSEDSNMDSIRLRSLSPRYCI